jgi:hypothetical protein
VKIKQYFQRGPGYYPALKITDDVVKHRRQIPKWFGALHLCSDGSLSFVTPGGDGIALQLGEWIVRKDLNYLALPGGYFESEYFEEPTK